MADPVVEALEEAIRIRKERAAIYGQDGYLVYGEVMAALFPDPLALETANDHARHNLLVLMIGKVVRYCRNYEQGGHADSLKDIQVYAAMLQVEDETNA